jgi:hypothetical protein
VTGIVAFSSAFGLRLWANRPIPGLRPLDQVSGVDVRVWLGVMPPLPEEPDGDAAPAAAPDLRIRRVAGGRYFYFRYPDGTEFVIDRPGCRVWADWPEPWVLEDTATYLLGPIFGFVLRLRGAVCLHASAVAVGDRALVLLGPRGAGKSTTAAAFARLGFPVLSDDIVALEQRGQGLVAHSGNPRLRLWPDSVRALFGSPDALPRLTPNWDKCYLDLTGPEFRFEGRSLPLAAVYVLDQRRDDPPAPRISPVVPREGLVTLLANTYASRILDARMRAQEFAVLGRLMASVPVRRVTPHPDPARLPALCHALLGDFRTLTCAAQAS